MPVDLIEEIVMFAVKNGVTDDSQVWGDCAEDAVPGSMRPELVALRSGYGRAEVPVLVGG